MAESVTVQRMFAEIAPRYDMANTVLSFGIHHLWRKALINMLPEASNKKVLDLCTGTGDLLPLLNKRFGNAVGADFCLPMLEQANEKKLSARFDLIQADALNLPFAESSFDIVSVAFGVRNFENLEKGLSEVYRVLKPGGSALILEFGQPKNRLFSALYNFYSKHFMPLLGGLISGNRTAYEYLPETAAAFPCRENFEAVLRKAGFTSTKYKTLTFGIAYAYCAEKGRHG